MATMTALVPVQQSHSFFVGRLDLSHFESIIVTFAALLEQEPERTSPRHEELRKNLEHLVLVCCVSLQGNELSRFLR